MNRMRHWALEAFSSLGVVIEHSDHLKQDPGDIGIPRWTATTSVAVALTGGEKTHRGEPVLEVVICESGTRADMYAENLAHLRECSSRSCITVWRAAVARAQRYPPPAFILMPGPTASCEAGNFPAEDWKNVTGEGYACNLIYDVQPQIADAIRARNKEALRPHAKLAHAGGRILPAHGELDALE